ncbi:MAG TPA: hypothetical protein VN633_17020 [Bryobacteraceae bacterium]|nr:hypothetical protein [Bryobacteraceae bacterium]
MTESTYDTTCMNLANVMRGETTAHHPTRTHHCGICNKDYPCGPAFCGTETAAAVCPHSHDYPCGGCFMRMLYD